MRVPAPGQIRDYEKNIRSSKEKLAKLAKGKKMIQDAVRKEEILKATGWLELWLQYANEVFQHMETTTIIHQQLLTKKNVLMDTNGQFVKDTDVMNTETIEVDPWTLIMMEKLVTVFGEEIKEDIEFH
ncbi:hypothetical protein AAXE64_27305 [Priestia megaterium]|uniref:hypothetical protein n=1 Tax=Priestia megaterium TaxID=1404 RepID=UPI003D08B280